MTKPTKVTLTSARDIPLNKLVLSQKNVRRIKNGQSIEQLAEDIAHRGLLQSLVVRSVFDGEGQETGAFEVPAGGRRLLALQLLAKQKRMTKNQGVPCIVREDGVAEDDSLAENTFREELHPLDQFRAFKALVDQGQSEEEVAARYFVSTLVVKQRLKLASVSPKLLEVYAAGEMRLDQLTAFAVSPNHAQQEAVWEALKHGYNREPYHIRGYLTRDQVSADDRRALFVGTEAYEAAGGEVVRDLFSQNGQGGWFSDPALLDRLALEKVQAAAAAIKTEGWKWVEAALSFPYGHTAGLRRLGPVQAAVDEGEAQRIAALREKYDELAAEHEGAEELPEEVDAQLAELEREVEAFDAKQLQYAPESKSIAGVFVSLGREGALNIEQGYVRPEDMPAPEPVPEAEGDGEDRGLVQRAVITIGGEQDTTPYNPASRAPEPEEEDPNRPLSERLMLELTTARTLALRDTLADDPNAAFVAVLHAMALKVFYMSYGVDTCLEIQTRSASPDRTVEGLDGFAPATSMLGRKENWQRQLPQDAKELWDFLLDLDTDSRASLFALCAALSVNAMLEPYNRRPDALSHANRLAEFLGLDMAQHWEPTAASFLGKVTKGRILSAVREAKGETQAQLIEHLKKADMAREAERLLAGTGWLPQPLRTPGIERATAPAASDEPAAGGETAVAEEGRTEPADAERAAELPAFLAGDEFPGDALVPSEPDVPAGDPDHFGVAAE